ncbi:MAG: glycosyltransferase [Prevotella sp.]|nr:glycosyltransferase [Prevotella sp.]
MEKFISRNIDSVISSKHNDDIELILVNDGSKDSTLEICKQYKERYPNVIRIIDKPNGHYGSCINAALKIAMGKYFRILDADDWFDTDALNAFITRLHTSDADLVVTLRCEVSEKEDGQYDYRYIPMSRIRYNEVYDAKSLRMNECASYLVFNMHSMTYKTSILRKAGLQLPEGVCYTDMIYNLTPIDRISTIVVYDIYLYHYLMGRIGSSTTGESIRRNFSHITTVLTHMLSHMSDHLSDNDTVRANQTLFVDEATGIFFDSIKHQGFCKKGEYEKIRFIVDKWKALGIKNRAFNKYYFKYWIKYNTLLTFNLSRLIYKVTHPFK